MKNQINKYNSIIESNRIQIKQLGKEYDFIRKDLTKVLSFYSRNLLLNEKSRLNNQINKLVSKNSEIREKIRNIKNKELKTSSNTDYANKEENKK